MSDYARTERRHLADLLLELGPDAPTMCAGWATRDLAAHLVIRERRPDAMIGMVVPPLAGHGEHIRRAKAEQPYADVVAEVRNPPWWSPMSNRLTDELVNTVEFFVHHEDVRRAQPGWEPRALDRGEENALWRAFRLTSRLTVRRLGRTVRVEAPGFGVIQVGDGAPAATVTGAPGEIVMFFAGRQRVARVEIAGDESIRTAKLPM